MEALLKESAIYHGLLRCKPSWWYAHREEFEAAGLPPIDPLFKRRPGHAVLTFFADRGILAYPQPNGATSAPSENGEGAAALRKLDERQNVIRAQQNQ